MKLVSSFFLPPHPQSLHLGALSRIMKLMNVSLGCIWAYPAHCRGPRVALTAGSRYFEFWFLILSLLFKQEGRGKERFGFRLRSLPVETLALHLPWAIAWKNLQNRWTEKNPRILENFFFCFWKCIGGSQILAFFFFFTLHFFHSENQFWDWLGENWRELERLEMFSIQLDGGSRALANFYFRSFSRIPFEFWFWSAYLFRVRKKRKLGSDFFLKGGMFAPPFLKCLIFKEH